MQRKAASADFSNSTIEPTNGSLRKYAMKTAVIKRSIFINGNKTSVSLENEFWNALKEIAKYKDTTVSKLVEEIARQRSTINLSSAIRIFVYNHFRSLEGKQKAGRTRLDSTSLRERAEEYRALAAGLNDEDSRTAMLKIAADYELMAARLESAAGRD